MHLIEFSKEAEHDLALPAPNNYIELSEIFESVVICTFRSHLDTFIPQIYLSVPN